MKTKTVQSYSLILAALAICLMPGCLLIDHEDPDCYGAYCNVGSGDISFYWGFELDSGDVTESCQFADISRVDIEVYDEFGDLEFSVMDRPCEDQGAELTNFRVGSYDIQLTGICRNGSITHEGWFSVWVDTNWNDFGTLMLDYIRPCN